MTQAIAVSQCEVDGKVYLRGDKMEVTEEQLDFLKRNGAAMEVSPTKVTQQTPQPTHPTMPTHSKDGVGTFSKK